MQCLAVYRICLFFRKAGMLMQYIGSELHDRMNLSGINLFALSEMILWMRKRLKRLKFVNEIMLKEA